MGQPRESGAEFFKAFLRRFSFLPVSEANPGSLSGYL